MDIRSRIMERTDRSGECWLWTGILFRNGYAQLSIKARPRLGHRVAYEEFVGLIPQGLELDHLCRVRRCVNPKHLEPVTRRENQARGVGPQAHGLRTNRCLNGHEYTPENTLMRSDRGRRCRTCHREVNRDACRERMRRIRARRAAARLAAATP